MKLPWPVVDTHCHVISSDKKRYPLDPMGGKQSAWSAERPVDAAGMLAAMADAGVAQAVLVQASTCYGHDNSYVAKCVLAHPQQFTGVYSADLLAQQTVEMIGNWRANGLGGVRFFVAGHSTADRSIRLDDPKANPVWAFASDAGIPVCIQIRADGLPQLDAVLASYPDLIVLLDHFARPDLHGGAPYREADAMWALSKYPRLTMKLTTHNLLESADAPGGAQAFCRAAVDVFGASRIAWGSNFPASAGGLTHQLQLAAQATAKLSAEEQGLIFSGTARRLYPELGAASVSA
jgi:predicted TIM-barrel fold metal-dependent hydrolase